MIATTRAQRARYVYLAATIALTCASASLSHAEPSDEFRNFEFDMEFNNDQMLSKLSDIQLLLRLQQQDERNRQRAEHEANYRYIPPPPKPLPTINDPYTYDPTRPGFSFPYKP